MNGPQPSFTSFHSAAEPPGLPGARYVSDDDVPIGFECANPALQIERWGQESEGALQESH